jgi:hypothetical protein
MPSLPSLPSLPLTTEAACAIGSAQEGATSMLQASDDSMWLDVTRWDRHVPNLDLCQGRDRRQPETTVIPVSSTSHYSIIFQHVSKCNLT